MLHFSIGAHHTKKNESVVIQHLCRCDFENLFWWHQFVENLKTPYHHVWTEHKLLCSPNRAPAIYPEKKLFKLSWRSSSGNHPGSSRESQCHQYSVEQQSCSIFEGTLKGSWEFFYTRTLFKKCSTVQNKTDRETFKKAKDVTTDHLICFHSNEINIRLDFGVSQYLIVSDVDQI